jgi:hypothetical protein
MELIRFKWSETFAGPAMMVDVTRGNQPKPDFSQYDESYLLSRRLFENRNRSEGKLF